MEESGSSARVGLRDTSSLASVSRACLSVSLRTITSFCLGLQERTTGKVTCQTENGTNLSAAVKKLYVLLVLNLSKKKTCENSLSNAWLEMAQKNKSR